jgi:hypothetical protein
MAAANEPEATSYLRQTLRNVLKTSYFSASPHVGPGRDSCLVVA